LFADDLDHNAVLNAGRPLPVPTVPASRQLTVSFNDHTSRLPPSGFAASS
jgi:hypothetical protein